ncbi:hypothetical protein KY329_02950 [Candidatus Woesearchaeota archaeon]|nr:hypothetical protein [Candidatus Woesearchaeota archaeon]
MKKRIAKCAMKIAKQVKAEAHKQAVRLTKAGMIAKEMVKPHAAKLMSEVKKELSIIEKKAKAEAKKELAKLKKKAAKKVKKTAKTIKKARKKKAKR